MESKDRWDKLKNAFLNAFAVLVNKRKVLWLDSVIFMGVCYLQMYGGLLEDNSNLSWDDDIIGSYIYKFFNIIRVIPYLKQQSMLGMYWFFYVLSILVGTLGCAHVVAVSALFLYFVVCAYRKVSYSDTLLNLTNRLLLYFYWLSFNVIIECLVTFTRCDSNGMKAFDSEFECYSALNVTCLVISYLMLVLTGVILFGMSLFYQSLHFSTEDALSQYFSRAANRWDSESSRVMSVCRLVSLVLTPYGDRTGWLALKLVADFLMAGVLSYRCVRFLQYFNKTVSVFFTFLNFVLAWILLNWVLVFILAMVGHFTIISVGVLPLYLLARRLYSWQVNKSLLTPTAEIATEEDAVFQCHCLQVACNSANSAEEFRLVGLINSHIKECKRPECPLDLPKGLYDPQQSMSVGSVESFELHKSRPYLQHICKTHYEMAIDNFSSCPHLRVAYAYFLLRSLRNFHSALAQVNIAMKSKGGISLSFEIFKFQQVLRMQERSERIKHKDLYYNLSRAIEFEQICNKFSRAMCEVSESQWAFWFHLQQAGTINFNVLNNSGMKMQRHADKAEKYWKQLCKINSSYTPIRVRYANYLKDIMNDEQKYNMIRETIRLISNKDLLDNIEKDNEVMFDEKAAIIHASGDKTNLGKILRVNSTAPKLFGLSHSEFVHSSLDRLMPPVIGKRHNQLMEKYFKTGVARILNREQYLYAQHRNGSCFKIKLLVREVVNLKDNYMEYIGLIVKIIDEHEYMLTSRAGRIFSMTENLAHTFNINPKLVYQFNEICVQLLFPNFVAGYGDSKTAEKCKEPSGEEVLLIVPQGLAGCVERNESFFSKLKASMNHADSSFSKSNELVSLKHEKFEDLGITAEALWKLPEYANAEFRARVRCHIQDLQYTTVKGKFR